MIWTSNFCINSISISCLIYFSLFCCKRTLFLFLFTIFFYNVKYYIGYPKDLGPSWVIHFTSECEFVKLLHEGHPVVVAFTIRSNYSRHLDKVLEEAAAEFYPHVKFMRVSIHICG